MGESADVTRSTDLIHDDDNNTVTSPRVALDNTNTSDQKKLSQRTNNSCSSQAND